MSNYLLLNHDKNIMSGQREEEEIIQEKGVLNSTSDSSLLRNKQNKSCSKVKKMLKL